VGDQNCVKNGFIYNFWGTSNDPSTWVQENTQTKKTRQLQRLIISQNVEEDEGV
jgi:hypothetical protein